MDRWDLGLLDPFEDHVAMLELLNTRESIKREQTEKSLFFRGGRDSEFLADLGQSPKKTEKDSFKIFPLVRPSGKDPLSSFKGRKKSSFVGFGKLRSRSIFNSKHKMMVSAVGSGVSLSRVRKVEGEGACGVRKSFGKEGLVDWKFSALRLAQDEDLSSVSGVNLIYLNENQIFSGFEDAEVGVIKNTFERLKKELLYKGKFRVVGIKNELQRLTRVRKFVVRVLENINKRENIVLCILTLGRLGGQDLEGMKNKLEKLNKLILVDIEKIKCSVLSIDKFVYFGEDYEEKIREDDRMILRIAA